MGLERNGKADELARKRAAAPLVAPEHFCGAVGPKFAGASVRRVSGC